MAHAGGYYYSDSGIVAMARGGAWVAGADNQFAQHYNPAGIIRVDRPVVNVGLSGVTQTIQFDRLMDNGEFLPTASNNAPPFSVPQLGFAMPIGDQFAFAVGFRSPFAPSADYDPEGAQRYIIIDSTVWQFTVGPSVAWQPVPAFTLGLGVGWQILRVEQSLKVSTSLIPNSDGSDKPEDDVLVSAEVWDAFTPSFNFGVLIEPIDQLSIGLSVEPPVKYKARGPASLDFTGHSLEASVNQLVYTDEDVALNLQLPLVVRLGVAVRPIETLEIEAATVYEHWKVLKEIVVEDIQLDIGLGSASLPVPDELSLPAGFRNTFSIRLGGEMQVHENLDIRAGGFWERSALSPQLVSVSLVDTDKVQLGMGVGLRFLDNRLRIDVSGAGLIFERLEIRDSEVAMINVINEDSGVIVGNGDLKSSGWMIGGQVAWGFGKSRKKTDVSSE